MFGKRTLKAIARKVNSAHDIIKLANSLYSLDIEENAELIYEILKEVYEKVYIVPKSQILDLKVLYKLALLRHVEYVKNCDYKNMSFEEIIVKAKDDNNIRFSELKEKIKKEVIAMASEVPVAFEDTTEKLNSWYKMAYDNLHNANGYRLTYLLYLPARLYPISSDKLENIFRNCYSASITPKVSEYYYAVLIFERYNDNHNLIPSDIKIDLNIKELILS